MNKPALIKGEPFQRGYGLNSSGVFTRYSFTDGKRQKFIRNLVTSVNDPYYKDAHQRAEMAETLKNLRANNFQFICFYCGPFENPFEFIEWVKAENKTFEIHGELFYECDGFTDFHGNLTTYSLSFMFRIYDSEVITKLKHLTEHMPKHYHYKR